MALNISIANKWSKNKTLPSAICVFLKSGQLMNLKPGYAKFQSAQQ